MNLLELIETMPGYSGATTDQAVLDWLNESVTVQQDVSYTDLLFGWAEPENTRYKLDAAFITHETTPYINSVYNSMLILRDAFSSGADFALSRNDVRETMNTLSGAGLPFSAANKTALFALSNAQVTRWTQADGVSHQTLGAIEAARGTA